MNESNKPTRMTVGRLKHLLDEWNVSDEAIVKMMVVTENGWKLQEPALASLPDGTAESSEPTLGIMIAPTF